MKNAATKLNMKNVLATLQNAQIFRASGGSWLKENPLEIASNLEKVQPGTVFLAYKGVRFDGHANIPEAIQRGTSAIVLDDPAAVPQCGKIPYALVDSSREAWPWLAAQRWGNPQNDLLMAAVTGTNGKTSTVWIMKELLRVSGRHCLGLGTIGAFLGDEKRETLHTTPDPDELFSLFQWAREKKARFVAMEVSSHALMQHKLGPIRFDGAVITSFSRDHLDFHGTMEEYWNAKWQLFERYLRGPGSLSCVCDDIAGQLRRMPPVGKSLWYGVARAGSEPRYQFKVHESHPGGTRLTVRDDHGNTRTGGIAFFGDYAIKNFVAGLMIADHFLQSPVDPLLWGKVRSVRGRLEPVWAHDPHRPMVFVDYAHTPDALEKVLTLLKQLVMGKLWVVFGCGGDRDHGKRPLMAAVAEKIADRVIVTSDNPRTESPEQIIDEIVAGFRKPAAIKRLGDRTAAIRWAIGQAEADDIVLIAGKGHEEYQIIGTEKLPFDDRQVARES